MTQNGYPFETQDTTEAEYSQLAREWQDTGVIDTYGGTGLKVTADSSGMQVAVAAGAAIVRGHRFASTSAETLPVSAAATQPRIDLVVVQLDPSSDTLALAVKAGVPAASPAPPSLTQTDTGVFELELARVTVAGSAVTIATAAVTDRRAFVGARTGSWDTATRPANPRRRQLGFNHTTSKWESWTGTAWEDLIPATVANAEKVGGLEIIRSATTPSGTPTTNRIWIKPLA